MMNKIQINSNALKNKIEKIPKRIIKTPPKICQRKAIQAKIINKIHGRELGMFLKTPLCSEPDIKAKTKKLIAITNNKILQKYIKYDFTFRFSISLFILPQNYNLRISKILSNFSLSIESRRFVKFSISFFASTFVS